MLYSYEKECSRFFYFNTTAQKPRDVEKKQVVKWYKQYDTIMSIL